MPPSKLVRSLGDGTAWAVPGDALSDLQHALRYENEDVVVRKRFYAATVIACYEALLALPQRERNARVRQIRVAGRALAEGE